MSRGTPAAVILAALMTPGCSEPTTGVVTGTVTVDGVPAESGSIAFFPVDGKSSTSGAEIVDGQYSAKASFGAHKVEIRVPKVVGEKKVYDTADSPVKQDFAESLPPRFNDETELTLEVKPGETHQDYDLTTR
jgi:hypothetical protein